MSSKNRLQITSQPDSAAEEPNCSWEGRILRLRPAHAAGLRSGCWRAQKAVRSGGITRRSIWLIIAMLVGLLLPVPRPAQALAAPTLLAPADGDLTTAASHPPLAIPEFAWAAVGGATSYRIQFSQDIGFASKVELTTPNTRYTPTDASKFGDGAWYWRVRVESPAPASDYSEVRSFTKQWAGSDTAPALTAPLDDAVLDFYDQPAFSWQGVIGAAAYRLEIATSPDGFAAPAKSWTTLATAYQPVAKLTNGNYYWRIVPVDAGGRDGMASAVRGFTASYNLAPTLLEPADGATPTFTPTFRWTAMRGAQFYRLQYATDPTFNAGVTSLDTRNTTYTPQNDLANDVNTYWRVRVHAGDAVSDWSTVRRFRKQWYIQAQTLMPTNNDQHVADPLFSWTPVPGAATYKFEINCAYSFPPASCGWSDTVANPFYSLRQVGGKWLTPGSWYWWRVTPIDGDNNQGQPSQVASFVYDNDTLTPQLAYPLYYYAPSDLLSPHEDRTVALPIFMWQRVPYSGTQAGAYRIEVDDDPLFGSLNWSFETANMSAAPTATQPFTPSAGVDYYWRVRALYSLTGGVMGDWSQKWLARIDTRLGLSPTVGAAPTLLRPVHASELIEGAPLLEWWPLSGANAYEVQIGADPTFATDVMDTAVVGYPAYATPVRLGYGSYYWRVRARQGDGAWGTWSAVWRFQVAAGSHWALRRTLGDYENRWRIASDPILDIDDPHYDVTDLFAAQSKDYWYFSFHAFPSAADTTYALYLDLDHADAAQAAAVDSGGAVLTCPTAGATDPYGFCVSTIAAHQPEYALYVTQRDYAFRPEGALIFRRSGTGWAAPQTFAEIGAALFYTPTGFYIELQIPSTAIGMDDTTGSLSVALFSAMPGGGHAQDTAPADPNVAFISPDAGSQVTVLSRFTAVSERLTLIAPPTNATGDPSVWPSLPPFFWHWPVDIMRSWHGFDFQSAVDIGFTSVVEQYTTRFVAAGVAPPSFTAADDFTGDNSYYWRVRPMYDSFKDYRGAWSEGGRIERAGLMPGNLRTSVTFATPTFSWNMVEGVSKYELQVDNDPGFGSPAVSVKMGRTSFTPTTALAKGVYYWRVRALRYSNIVNDWTPAQIFTLDLPRPTGLAHHPAGAVTRAPTLCWPPLLALDGTTPVLAAWRYRVQVSRDPTFSTTYDTIETEQACWTPTKGYEDGGYYWRVAVIDGNNQLADYSAAASFTKQYLISDLLSPTERELVRRTPTFAWTPLMGAASYKLEVSISSSFTAIYDQVTTNNTRYTPTKTYAGGKTYYWRVAMLDKDKRQGPFNGSLVVLALYPYATYLPVAVR